MPLAATNPTATINAPVEISGGASGSNQFWLVSGTCSIEAYDSNGYALNVSAVGALATLSTDTTLKTEGGSIYVLGELDTTFGVTLDLRSDTGHGELWIDDNGSGTFGLMVLGAAGATTTLDGDLLCDGMMKATIGNNDICSCLDLTGYTADIGGTGSPKITKIEIDNPVGSGVTGSTWTFMKASTFDGEGWTTVQLPTSPTMYYHTTSTTEYVSKAM
jgi:hypothetical protein